MGIRKHLFGVVLAASLISSSFYSYAAEESTDVIESSYEEGNDKHSGSSLVKAQDDKLVSTFFVKIPKKITLDSTGSANYAVQVTGDIYGNEEVLVEPVDTISDRDGVNFFMKAQPDLTRQLPADIDHKKDTWSCNDVVNSVEVTDNSVTCNHLSAGQWVGSFNFNINLRESGVADDNANTASDWDYTLDEDSGIIYLNKYNGSDVSVTVCDFYKVGNKRYSTEVKGNQLFTDSEVETVEFSDGVKFGASGLEYAFFSCYNLKSVTFGDVDTSACTSFSSTFEDCYSLTNINGLSNLDTSSITIMCNVFEDCSSLVQLDLSSWDINNIGDFENAFYNCTKLERVTFGDSSSFANATNTSGMFSGCASLKEVSVSDKYNPPASCDKDQMFNNAGVSQVTVRGLKLAIVDNDLQENHIGVGTSVSLGLVKSDGTAYSDGYINEITCSDENVSITCNGNNITLNSVNGYESGETFNVSVNGYSDLQLAYAEVSPTIDELLKYGSYCDDTSAYLYNYAGTDKSVIVYDYYTSITGEYFRTKITGKAGNTGKKLFNDNDVIESIRFCNLIDYSEFTDASNMFSENANLYDIQLGDMDTSRVTNMKSMFQHINYWKQADMILDVQMFDVSNVTTMREMFAEGYIDQIDMYWDSSSKLTSMYRMFYDNDSLHDINGLYLLDTSNVVDMTDLFGSCNSLAYIDIYGWDTRNVENASFMFEHCSIKTIVFGDLCTFEKCNDFDSMFAYAGDISSIDISVLSTGNAINMVSMFEGLTNLTEIIVGDNWVISEECVVDNMFRNCGVSDVTKVSN